jgi:hypothetical protein
MRLQQLKLEYITEQDRLLLRLSTEQSAEILVWLTRLCVKQLWHVLLDIAHAIPEVALQTNAEVRNALLGFRHAAAVSEADFDQRYEEVPRVYPLGREPLLIVRVEARKGEKGPHALGLYPERGEGVHINLDEKLLHGVIKLIENGVANADWDLTLKIAPTTVPIMSDDDRPTIN